MKKTGEAHIFANFLTVKNDRNIYVINKPITCMISYKKCKWLFYKDNLDNKYHPMKPIVAMLE